MKLKKLLSLALSLMLILSAVPMGLFSITASAETATSGTTGDCTWTLDGTVLTISGEGQMGNYQNSDLPWGESITEVIIKPGVATIGGFAFSNCTELKSVIIPNSVTSIGNWAFSCCTKLTNITLPNSVTKIEVHAFSYCSGLTSITIPDSVTSIGNWAFSGCEIKELIIAKGSKNVTSAIVVCKKNLEKVIIPDGVANILEGAFLGCTGLTNITIPNSVTSIGDGAFQNCTGLTSVTIPGSIASVKSNIFYGCDNITDVSISQNLISNFKTVFRNYNKIKSIALDENTVYISELAFSGCTELENIYLSDGVTSIGNYAFYGCKNLAGVSIPNSLTDIGNYAFYRCSALKNITIPQSVTKIEDYAFKDTAPEFKIFTVENSAAHKFAIKNNKNYYLTELTSPVLSPIVEDIRNNDNKSVEVRLKNNEGYEYKCDDGEWQTSSVFEIFNYNSYHNFYQRIAETEKHVKSKETGIEGIYLKNKNINIPEAPEIALKTYNSISLKSVQGYEYSIDGVNWQASPMFVGLLPATKYFMYQREAETPTCFAGAASAALIVRTPDKAGDINGDGVIDIRDLISLKKFFADPSNNNVSSECLDISDDGKINSADLAALRENLLLK